MKRFHDIFKYGLVLLIAFLSYGLPYDDDDADGNEALSVSSDIGFSSRDSLPEFLNYAVSGISDTTSISYSTRPIKKVRIRYQGRNVYFKPSFKPDVAEVFFYRFFKAKHCQYDAFVENQFFLSFNLRGPPAFTV